MTFRSAAVLFLAVHIAIRSWHFPGIICCAAFTPCGTFPSWGATKVRSISALQRRKNNEEEDEMEDSTIPRLPALGAAKSSSLSGSGTERNEGSLLSTPSAATSSDSQQFNATKPTAFVSPKFELQYTCNVCETRNRVIVNRMAYQKGMVIAICKGCDAKHWIADNLDPTLTSNNIEELFASRDGEQRVSRVTREVYDIERVWEFTAGELTDNQGNPVLE
ncbi:DNL zinc finger-domain containing protein [Nitzschia inconspicua]|uniref:DNL zinc finger-domain containing protein n=1 Tax=Nitzschia inconspicua TaxID=303405 RepID=A0A9K3KQA4_9STRA|nr:DNL zinc finger-domain containing protein [Nitzschia inconspicua]